jgi:hypothetical protein
MCDEDAGVADNDAVTVWLPKFVVLTPYPGDCAGYAIASGDAVGYAVIDGLGEGDALVTNVQTPARLELSIARKIANKAPSIAKMRIDFKVFS